MNLVMEEGEVRQLAGKRQQHAERRAAGAGGVEQADAKAMDVALLRGGEKFQQAYGIVKSSVSVKLARPARTCCVS